MTDAIDNPLLLKRRAISSTKLKFTDFWHKTIAGEASNRLQFYKVIKNEFKFEEYLTIPIFESRKVITKIRCSDHPLEVEKGRHRNVPRESRICKLCPLGEVETEDHFLTKCAFFDRLKLKHDLPHTTDSKDFVNNTEYDKLGRFLTEAFAVRMKHIENLPLS